MFFSFFFPNLINVPEHILHEKGVDAIFKQKGKKIVNWHKNGSFSVVFKVKGCNYHMYIISRVCPTYIFSFGIIFSRTTLAETIFEMQAKKSRDTVVVGGAAKFCQRGLKEWRTLGPVPEQKRKIVTLTVAMLSKK